MISECAGEWGRRWGEEKKRNEVVYIEERERERKRRKQNNFLLAKIGPPWSHFKARPDDFNFWK